MAKALDIIGSGGIGGAPAGNGLRKHIGIFKIVIGHIVGAGRTIEVKLNIIKLAPGVANPIRINTYFALCIGNIDIGDGDLGPGSGTGYIGGKGTATIIFAPR